jgi:hypothetical protein
MLSIVMGSNAMRGGLLSLLLGTLLFVPLEARAQTWTWTSADVDLEGYGTSIQSDHDGNLHLSYYAPSGGFVKYAFLPAGESKWYKMSIDQNLGVLETGLTLDAAGNPHICYTPREIRYAHFDGHKWTKQEVDSGSGLIAYICSIQVTPSGKPMMSWYLESGTYLRFAILEGGAWMAQSIQGGQGNYPGKWTSIALDGRGFPRISYSDFPIGQLKYASFDGKIWTTSLVDVPETSSQGGQRGMGNSLILDAQGQPMICYYDEQSLKMARYLEGHWQKETIEQLPNFGRWSWKNFRSSLVLDSKGNPHIGFESIQGLEHAWWDGNKWRTQLIVTSLGSPFYENAMTIDKNDVLYISYRDPGDGTLRIAIGRAASGQPPAGAQKVISPS